MTALLNPTVRRYMLLRLWTRRHKRAQRLYFVVNIRSQVRATREAFTLLQERGYDCVYVGGSLSSEGRCELEFHGHDYIDLDSMFVSFRRGDVILLCNDWLPDPALSDAVDYLKNKGLAVIGISVEFRYYPSVQFHRVQQLLVWGPEATLYYDFPITIVGSSVLEAFIKNLIWKPDSDRYALVNYKFGFGKEDEDGSWLRAIREACDAVGLRLVISLHPNTPNVPPDLNPSPEEFRDLLPGCSILISRPSSVLFEAMAIGVPVVAVPVENENLGPFQFPNNAFSIVTDFANLADHIRDNLAPTAARRDATLAFLNQHISINPGVPASVRMADAIDQIAKDTQR